MPEPLSARAWACAARGHNAILPMTRCRCDAGRIYMLCNWIMVILGVLMLLFAFTTSFTGNVINTVNTEFDNNWEQCATPPPRHTPHDDVSCPEFDNNWEQ